MTNQDQMWMPTQDDAVEIYARYMMGRHGKSAHHYARKTADKLKREGDLEGYSIWSCVADAVERTAGKSNNVTSTVKADMAPRDRG
jgi:hypothetical protein